MHVIKARNVNDAYNNALWHMSLVGRDEPSRNGLVKVAPTPVATVYSHPLERMLYDVQRDANPFFHVVESIWMLAGRNDVKSVQRYASNMSDFSDDGISLNGAYGFRWREHFAYDQLGEIVALMRKEPETRRAVLSMWDPVFDLESAAASKDIPCNTHAYFRIQEGRLHLTVCNRSNDIVWGCYGANAVHMSFLLEYMALAIGVGVGTYTQVSNNWHIYERHFGLLERKLTTLEYDAYWEHGKNKVGLFSSSSWDETFLLECEQFFEDPTGSFDCAYFNHVAIPLSKAWGSYKGGDHERALMYAGTIVDKPISIACEQWIQRRMK